MATLTELRSFVRAQTQTLPDELPDVWIDPWLREGFDRTIAAYTAWPFYEETWELTVPAGAYRVDLPANAHYPGIVSLSAPGRRLRMINAETAETEYENTLSSAHPVEFSVWGDVITLWPNKPLHPTEQTLLTLRGFRRSDPFPTDPSQSLDCDERLHTPIAHYAIALAYAQQEDEVLEVVYMTRWQRDVEMAARAIMEPARHRQIVMGPRYRSHHQPGYPFVVNTGSP